MLEKDVGKHSAKAYGDEFVCYIVVDNNYMCGCAVPKVEKHVKLTQAEKKAKNRIVLTAAHCVLYTDSSK